jgi:protein-S-isoprenylcysteine O-methyltransferase Ste14
MGEGVDSPGVRVPPPLLNAAAVIGGLLLNRRWPLAIGAGGFGRVLASLLIAAWAVVTAISFQSFWRMRTSIVPIRPATALVIGGPYRFTRNPMYVGLGFLTVALGLLLDSWWPILLVIPTLMCIRQFVILPEERYLRRRFGGEYDAYTRQVRRWL